MPGQRHTDGLPTVATVVSKVGDFPHEAYSIEPDAMRRLLGPAVYEVWGTSECLYIGSAKNVLARMAEADHRSFLLALCEARMIFVIMADSEMQARQIEAELIARNQPRLNAIGKNAERFRADIDAFRLEQFLETFRAELAQRL